MVAVDYIQVKCFACLTKIGDIKSEDLKNIIRSKGNKKMEIIENEIDRLIAEQEKIIAQKQRLIDEKKALKAKLDAKFKIGNIINNHAIICANYKLIEHKGMVCVAVLVHYNLSFDGMSLDSQSTTKQDYKGKVIHLDSASETPHLNFAGACDMIVFPLTYIDEIKTKTLEDAFIEVKENHMELYAYYLEEKIADSLNYYLDQIQKHEEQLKELQKTYSEILSLYENRTESFKKAYDEYDDNIKLQVKSELDKHKSYFNSDGSFHYFLDKDGKIDKSARYVREFGFDEKK